VTGVWMGEDFVVTKGEEGCGPVVLLGVVVESGIALPLVIGMFGWVVMPEVGVV